MTSPLTTRMLFSKQFLSPGSNCTHDVATDHSHVILQTIPFTWLQLHLVHECLHHATDDFSRCLRKSCASERPCSSRTRGCQWICQTREQGGHRIGRVRGYDARF